MKGIYKKMKKKLALLMAVIVITTTLSGCNNGTSSNVGDSGTSNTVTALSEWGVDENKVIASIKSEGIEDADYFNITFGQWWREYAFTLANKNIEENNANYADNINYYRNNTISMLTNERILLREAKLAGYDNLTEAEIKEIDDANQKILTGWYESFESDALAADENLTGDALLAKEKELFNNYLSKFNLTGDDFLIWQKYSYIENKLMEEKTKDITVTDAEAQEYVDNYIKEAKEAYEKSPATYEQTAAYQAVHIPEGSKRIKYIYIGLDKADATELYNERNESGADQEKLDKKRDELLAGIQTKADDILKKVKAEGADFDALMKEHSSDYSEDAAGKTILIVNKTSSIPEELYNKIESLKNIGDISDLVATDGGYYIVQYAESAALTEADKTAAFDAAKESLLDAKKSKSLNALLLEWQKKYNYEIDYDTLKITQEAETTDTTSNNSTSAE